MQESTPTAPACFYPPSLLIPLTHDRAQYRPLCVSEITAAAPLRPELPLHGCTHVCSSVLVVSGGTLLQSHAGIPICGEGPTTCYYMGNSKQHEGARYRVKQQLGRVYLRSSSGANAYAIAGPSHCHVLLALMMRPPVPTNVDVVTTRSELVGRT